MNSQPYELLYHSNNPLIIDLLVNILKENNIPYYVAQESVGKEIYPVLVGKLSDVDLYVPIDVFNQAKELIEAYLSDSSDETSTENE